MAEKFEEGLFAMGSLRQLFRKLKYSLQKTDSDPVVNLDCTEFEINNWTVSDFIVHELIPLVGTHPYPICELNLLVAAVCRLKPKQVFEWGTNIGISARVFRETAKKFNLTLEIHSIDLPDDVEHVEHPQGKRGMMVRGLPEVTLHYGDGLEKTLEIFGKSLEQTPPLIFIDGDHSYEAVKRELRGVIENIPKVSIILHDTFYQSEKSEYNIGPHQAITEILREVPDRFKVISTTTGLPGMTLLYQL